MHTLGAQLGLPVEPADNSAHVPSVVAPVATEQASQAPLHAVSQHTPSAQFPVEHTRQPACLQSLVVLQVAPWPFCATHCPLVEQ